MHAARGPFLNRYLPDLSVPARSGSFGRVLCGTDQKSGQRVAIKLPLEPNEPRFSRALMNEAAAAASMSHPRIVSLLDHGWDPVDGPVLIFPWFGSGSLADRLRGPHPLGWRDALQIVDDLLAALAHVHGRGQIHRDVAPRNVLLGRAADRVRASLADLGVAKEHDRLLRERTPLSPVFLDNQPIRPSRKADIVAVARIASAICAHAVLLAHPDDDGESSELTGARLLRAEWPDDWPELVAAISREAGSESSSRVRTVVQRAVGSEAPVEAGAIGSGTDAARLGVGECLRPALLPPGGHPLPLWRVGVDDVLLQVIQNASSGEVVRVTGPVGCGKTAALDRAWLTLSESTVWELHHVRVGDDGFARVVGRLDAGIRSPKRPVSRMPHDPLVATAARLLQESHDDPRGTGAAHRVIFRLDGKAADAQAFAADVGNLAREVSAEFVVLVEGGEVAPAPSAREVPIPPLSLVQRCQILAKWVGEARAAAIDERVQGDIHQGVAWARIESRHAAATELPLRQLEAESVTKALCGGGHTRPPMAAALWGLVALGDAVPLSSLEALNTSEEWREACRALVRDAEALSLASPTADDGIRWGLPFPPELLLPQVEARLRTASDWVVDPIAVVELIGSTSPHRAGEVLAGIARRGLLAPSPRALNLACSLALETANAQPAATLDMLQPVDSWTTSIKPDPALLARLGLAQCAARAASSNRIGPELATRIDAFGSHRLERDDRRRLHPLRIRLALERGHAPSAEQAVEDWLRDTRGEAVELARVHVYGALAQLWRCTVDLDGATLRTLLLQARTQLQSALRTCLDLATSEIGQPNVRVVVGHGLVRVAERLRVLLGVLDTAELTAVVQTLRDDCGQAVATAHKESALGLEAAGLKEAAALLFFARGPQALDEVNGMLDRAKLAALRGGFGVESLHIENVRMDLSLRAGRPTAALATAIRQLANPRIEASPKLQLNARLTACIARGAPRNSVVDLLASAQLAGLLPFSEVLTWCSSPSPLGDSQLRRWMSAARRVNAVSEVGWLIAAGAQGRPQLAQTAETAIRVLPSGAAWEALRRHLLDGTWPDE